MRLSHEELASHLELLRHGGADAVELFVDVARQFFEQGDADYISSWVGVASPALPEFDRHVALTLLLRAFFRDDNIEAEVHEEHPKLQ